jgi:acetaldehyde dehydrogenase
MNATKVAVLGSGNIGTDLMMKVLRAPSLQMTAMVGIDRDSDGLARARRHDVVAVCDGIHGLIARDDFADIDIVFDATSAKAHLANAHALSRYGKRLIDLTPAAIGPFVVPAVNLDEHLNAANMNMVTCGRRSPPAPPGRAPEPISTSSPKPLHAPSKSSAAHAAGRR